MRRLFIILLVATIVTATSAFINAKQASNKRFSVIYYQHFNGLYTKVAPSNRCDVVTVTPCTITYLSDPGVTSFIYASRPLTARQESAALGKGIN